MPLVGTLMSFSGTVTRTSEVRPELLYGRFKCADCGTLSRPIEQQFKYTEPSMCATEECMNRSRWELDVPRSRFCDWQRLRVQENADEIPPGSLPRSVDVVLRNGAVDKAKAGDRLIFTGTLVVIPDVTQLYKAGQVTTASSRPSSGVSGKGGAEGITGLKALGVRDLTYRVAFVAQSVAKGSARNVRTLDADAEAPDAEQAENFGEDEIVRG